MISHDDAQAAAYYNSRPKKATGVGVLFFNNKGEVLIVKPTYLDRWLWVGGGIEQNETPKAAALRECQEEIGITPHDLTLAFAHYLSPKPNGQSETIHIVFVAKPVDETFITTLKLAEGEIENALFVPVDDLPRYVSDKRAGAVKAYVEHPLKGSGLYIEDGQLA